MRLTDILQSLWQRYQPAWQRHHPGWQPLLDDEQLNAIQLAASGQQLPLLPLHKEVKHLLLGENQSTYMGSGYEFADNRPFVHGDDTRRINWQLLARSGQLYRKVFNEEHRSQLWLVMDRRSPMRFGTRKRLKVSQAAMQAIFHNYQAQQHNIASGAIMFDRDIQQLQPSQQSASLIQQLITPCPPLSDELEQVQLEQVLRLLQAQLSPGCIIILLSDFHDLRDAANAMLHQLAMQHHVLAYHVLDPVELDLPKQGQYALLQNNSSSPLIVNSDNDELRSRYHEQMQQRHHQVQQQLQAAGIYYQQLLADQELFPLTGEQHA